MDQLQNKLKRYTAEIQALKTRGIGKCSVQFADPAFDLVAFCLSD